MSKINLKQAREQAGLTKSYVAEQAGVQIQTITRWETGKTSPNMEQGMYLALLYDLSVSDIDFSKDAQEARS